MAKTEGLGKAQQEMLNLKAIVGKKKRWSIFSAGAVCFEFYQKSDEMEE